MHMHAEECAHAHTCVHTHTHAHTKHTCTQTHTKKGLLERAEVGPGLAQGNMVYDERQGCFTRSVAQLGSFLPIGQGHRVFGTLGHTAAQQG